MVKRIGLVVFSCSSIFFLGVASLVLLVLTFSPSTVHAGPYTWNAVITGAKIQPTLPGFYDNEKISNS